MIEAAERIWRRVARNRNDVLSWTLSLASAACGGVSIVNSVNASLLPVNRVVWVAGENPPNMSGKPEKINEELTQEFQKSLVTAVGTIGVAYILIRTAQGVDKRAAS